MTLSWTPPEDNGGSTIAGYIIERKEVGSDRWICINKNPVTMTRYRATGLIEGLEYEYRVTAINSRGSGKPSTNSKPTIAMDPIGMYKGHLQVNRVVNRTSITIVFKFSLKQSLLVFH